jgi:hypothetical protein
MLDEDFKIHQWREMREEGLWVVNGRTSDLLEGQHGERYARKAEGLMVTADLVANGERCESW